MIFRNIRKNKLHNNTFIDLRCFWKLNMISIFIFLRWYLFNKDDVFWCFRVYENVFLRVNMDWCFSFLLKYGIVLLNINLCINLFGIYMRVWSRKPCNLVVGNSRHNIEIYRSIFYLNTWYVLILLNSELPSFCHLGGSLLQSIVLISEFNTAEDCRYTVLRVSDHKFSGNFGLWAFYFLYIAFVSK